LGDSYRVSWSSVTNGGSERVGGGVGGAVLVRFDEEKKSGGCVFWGLSGFSGVVCVIIVVNVRVASVSG
jgi:hypothetical protein